MGPSHTTRPSARVESGPICSRHHTGRLGIRAEVHPDHDALPIVPVPVNVVVVDRDLPL